MSQAHKDTMLIITGAAGVLGRMLLEEAHKRDDSEQLQIVGLTREDWDFQKKQGKAPLIFESPKRRVLINCAGKIRDVGNYSPRTMSYINAFLPHALASSLHQDRVVQISTDCVFSGAAGPYFESAIPSPTDLYGATKLAGELTDPEYKDRNVLTIRMSFIGLGKRGLLRRFLDQEESFVTGFKTWWWNGLYARTAARVVLDWALNDSMTGLVHLEGPVIRKYRLYEMLVDRFRPELDLRPESPARKNLVLASNTDANDLYEFNWEDMIDELYADWHERWSETKGDWRQD